jgi:hypothetical protein
LINGRRRCNELGDVNTKGYGRNRWAFPFQYGHFLSCWYSHDENRKQEVTVTVTQTSCSERPQSNHVWSFVLPYSTAGITSSCCGPYAMSQTETISGEGREDSFEPFLPPEIEREIFELTAQFPGNAVNLVLVARRTQIWYGRCIQSFVSR